MNSNRTGNLRVKSWRCQSLYISRALRQHPLLPSDLHLAGEMPREAEPSLNERAFIIEALQENVRLDGRALDAYRDLDISFGDDYGVADVRLGKTRSIKKHLQYTALWLTRKTTES